MFLAVDIGNTSITFGVFNNKKLNKRFYIKTSTKVSALSLELKKGMYKKKIKQAILCSVVPKKTKVIQQLLKNLKMQVMIVGKDVKVPIRNLYKDPKQVGKDRLVNAYACKLIYGTPAVIIDFGTATTFDYINSKEEYMGGIIAPGIEISLEALFKKTALLPKVKLSGPTTFLGRSTVNSIKSGASHGLACMCDGLIQGFRKRSKKKIKVIATGGLADYFKKRCKNIEIVDKDLTLKGLAEIFYI